MSVKEIDAENLTPRELNSQIKEFAAEYDKILIKNPNAKHYLAAGVVDDSEIEFDGSVGYFAGTMCDKAKIKINGNAGWFVGDNITGGEGGAIMLKGSHNTIENSKFYQNTAEYSGGAIYLMGMSSENCTNNTFKYCCK